MGTKIDKNMYNSNTLLKKIFIQKDSLSTNEKPKNTVGNEKINNNNSFSAKKSNNNSNYIFQSPPLQTILSSDDNLSSMGKDNSTEFTTATEITPMQTPDFPIANKMKKSLSKSKSSSSSNKKKKEVKHGEEDFLFPNFIACGKIPFETFEIREEYLQNKNKFMTENQVISPFKMKPRSEYSIFPSFPDGLYLPYLG